MPFWPLCYESEAILFKNFCSGSQAGVVHTRKFPSRLTRNLGPVFLFEHVEIFTNGRGARRYLGTRASPVDRAHMRRPLKVFFVKSVALLRITHQCRQYQPLRNF